MSAVRSLFERAIEAKVPAGPTPRPEGVRIAVQADEKAIFDLLMTRAAEENALAPVNEFKVLSTIKLATERKGAVIGVIEEQSEIAASVGLIMGQFWYSEQWHYQDLWCYVHPEYRRHRRGNTNFAQMLLQFVKWWGEQAGACVFMGVATTDRTLAKVRLFARQMPIIGAGFWWRGSSGG